MKLLLLVVLSVLSTLESVNAQVYSFSDPDTDRDDRMGLFYGSAVEIAGVTPPGKSLMGVAKGSQWLSDFFYKSEERARTEEYELVKRRNTYSPEVQKGMELMYGENWNEQPENSQEAKMRRMDTVFNAVKNLWGVKGSIKDDAANAYQKEVISRLVKDKDGKSGYDKTGQEKAEANAKTKAITEDPKNPGATVDESLIKRTSEGLKPEDSFKITEDIGCAIKIDPKTGVVVNGREKECRAIVKGKSNVEKATKGGESKAVNAKQVDVVLLMPMGSQKLGDPGKNVIKSAGGFHATTGTYCKASDMQMTQTGVNVVQKCAKGKFIQPTAEADKGIKYGIQETTKTQ